MRSGSHVNEARSCWLPYDKNEMACTNIVRPKFLFRGLGKKKKSWSSILIFDTLRVVVADSVDTRHGWSAIFLLSRVTPVFRPLSYLICSTFMEVLQN